MSISRKLMMTTGLVAAMALAAPAAVLAKAHDNGVGDGTPSGGANVGGQTAGQGGNGVSGAVSGGQRGDSASGAGGDNSGGNGNSDGDGGPAANNDGPPGQR